MGVPSFYRWLVEKYPNTVSKSIQPNPESISTNPNGDFDNLYLDMNNIIHPCFHPEDVDISPTTFQHVFESCFEYIDRLFDIVRPRKLLYMAIDGVAPRAKMNQQRTRRFRAAKDHELIEAEESRLRCQFESQGKHVLPHVESEVADSNIITPGTVFLHELSKVLQAYIHKRLKTDSWKSIKVILSDSNVPGEGEHKIMSYIRFQRSMPDYDPNTRHCLYGLDADLIMLALATHEVHFSILREKVTQHRNHMDNNTLASLSEAAEPSSESSAVNSNQASMKKPYEFLNIWILREYLELDMDISDLPHNMKAIDFERIIDDFIFLCFFAGNDFLPHMPTLEISEGAIDLLMTVYKQKFKKFGGYLVDMQRVEDNKGEYINKSRVEKFILLIGTYEAKIFSKRSKILLNKIRRMINEKSTELNDEADNVDTVIFPVLEHLASTKKCSSDDEIARKNTKELKEQLKVYMDCRSDMFRGESLGLDRIKLGDVGWKQRYYKYKFSVEGAQDVENIRQSIVKSYTEGLLWVLLYYFFGVMSWNWYYQFQYGPFASDMIGLAQVKDIFQKGPKGSPFSPFNQLMGVLPPRSAHALPKPYRYLMTDKSSKIIDFYPTDFEVDTEGKRFLWQGICKLPFIVEDRLLAETTAIEKALEDHELSRNTFGFDRLFVRSNNDLGVLISSSLHKANPDQNDFFNIEAGSSGGFSGLVCTNQINCHTVDSGDFQGNDVINVFFKLPDDQLPHITRVLPGVTFPEKTITEADIMETFLWHDYWGQKPLVARSSSSNLKNDRNPDSSTDVSSSARHKDTEHQDTYCRGMQSQFGGHGNIQWRSPMPCGFRGRGRGSTSERPHFVPEAGFTGLRLNNYSFRPRIGPNSGRPMQSQFRGHENVQWRSPMQSGFSGRGRGRSTSEQPHFVPEVGLTGPRLNSYSFRPGFGSNYSLNPRSAMLPDRVQPRPTGYNAYARAHHINDLHNSVPEYYGRRNSYGNNLRGRVHYVARDYPPSTNICTPSSDLKK